MEGRWKESGRKEETEREAERKGGR